MHEVFLGFLGEREGGSKGVGSKEGRRSPRGEGRGGRGPKGGEGPWTFIRDPDVGEFNGLDGRRGGESGFSATLARAMDTTVVSPWHGDRTARRGWRASAVSGIARSA